MKQRGSVHTILIVGLVIALIGALGFIYWQNFVVDGSSVKTDSSANSDSGTSTTTDDKRAATEAEITSRLRAGDYAFEDLMATQVTSGVFGAAGDTPKQNDKEQVAASAASYLAGRVSNDWKSSEFEEINGHSEFKTMANSSSDFDFTGSFVSIETGSDYEDFIAFKIGDDGLITSMYFGSVELLS